MLTTYENPSLALCVISYGWKPAYKGFRIKNYQMRLAHKISPASLARINRTLDSMYPVVSDTSENWHRIIWTKRV